MREIEELVNLDNYIQSELIVDECGIDLQRLGTRTYLKKFPLAFKSKIQLDNDEISKEIKVINHFIDSLSSKNEKKPSWYKINVIDQAINEYVGLGFLNIDAQFDWLSFITTYLCNDRAEQGGDTILVIFDSAIEWALCFTLSTDQSYFSIEKFEKEP